jgi:mannose-6-phosphate isomerase-like protein (cupin superfamily)
MIVRTDGYVIISKNSNNVYWEEGLYPGWTAINVFRDFPGQVRGAGVEPHYHDGDEIWLFYSGRGEVWLDGQSYEITPNTAVYTPMGAVHRFQMFTDFGDATIVTRLERQKRAAHLLVEEAGPPVPTVPGFVVPGASNNGPFQGAGPRCPLSELRTVAFGAGGGIGEGRLQRNEHWLVVDGEIDLTVDGCAVALAPGDVALLRAGVVRRIEAAGRASVALARERVGQAEMGE